MGCTESMAEEWIGAQVVFLWEETVHHLSAEAARVWGCIPWAQTRFHLCCWKLHCVRAACYCSKKISGVFSRQKVGEDRWTAFRHNQSCCREAGNELYPMPLRTQWSPRVLTKAREISGWPSGKISWLEGEGSTAVVCQRKAEAQLWEDFKKTSVRKAWDRADLALRQEPGTLTSRGLFQHRVLLSLLTTPSPLDPWHAVSSALFLSGKGDEDDCIFESTARISTCHLMVSFKALGVKRSPQCTC